VGVRSSRVEVIGCPERLQAIREPWRRLWHATAAATPFAHPAWLTSASDVFPADGLLAVASWRGATLDALAVLGVSAGELHLIGRGVSDYLDALVLPGARRSFGVELTRALEGASCWDRAVLTDLPAASIVLSSGAPRGCSDEAAPHAVCPVLDLADPGAVPARRRRELAYEERRALRRGAALRVVTEAGDAQRAFDELVRLHEARWSARGQPGVLADEAVQRFHRAAIARGLADDGVARLVRLDVRDRCVGVLYALAAHRRAHYYISGFDPDVRDLGAGVLLIGRAIEDARAHGAAELDFLRGAEPYKYTWGARDRPTYRRSLVRAGARGITRPPSAGATSRT